MAIDRSYQNIGLQIIVAFPVLGGIAVILRYWSRFLSRTSFAIDDLFITVGYILAVVQSVTSWFFVKTNYIGIHIWDIPTDRDLKEARIWDFANQLIYNPSLTMIKISIILFLRRLKSRSPLVNYLIWSSLVITVALFLAVILVDIFQCHPVAYFYDRSIPGGTCIQQGAFYVATAATNLFTDLMVLSIPIIITWSLQMPLARKLAVCMILCLGGVATAIGIWRVILLAQLYYPTGYNPDPTYSIGFCSSAVEVNVAVIAACAPSTKIILAKYLPRLLGPSKGTHSESHTGPMSGWSRNPLSRSGAGFSQTKSTRGAPGNFELSSREWQQTGPRHRDSVSLGSDEEAAGIRQTIDVSVQYTTSKPSASPELPSREQRTGSVEQLI